MTEWFKYVPDAHVEDYFAMGWVMCERPALYDPPGGGAAPAWMMHYPCKCFDPPPTRRR